MSRINKKWFLNFLFSNLNDVEVSSPDVDQVSFFDSSSSKWKNGDTSNVLLLTPNILNRSLFVPAGKTGIMNSFRSNGYRVRSEGRLRVL